MQNIAIRVDGGIGIGMGHVIRTLSLAKAFRKQGYKVFFISKEKEGILKIQEENFQVIKINEIKSKTIINKDGCYKESNNLEEEVKEIIEIIQKYSLDLLIVDSYDVTEEYFLTIKPHIKKLCYIDDINKFVYPVDILINGNITAEYMDYKKYFKNQIMLLGLKYNLIRDEFRNLPKRKIREEVKEIMITTGSSDPYNMSSKLLNWLLKDKELSKLTYNVIVGNMFQNKEELNNIKKANPNVVLYQDIKAISEIMLKSDIAISAGGSTLYELCVCGTPTLAFIMADNQKLIVEKMQELGYVKSLGEHICLSENTLLNNLKKLLKETKTRIKYNKKQQKLIDMKGASRIVKECIKI